MIEDFKMIIEMTKEIEVIKNQIKSLIGLGTESDPYEQDYEKIDFLFDEQQKKIDMIMDLTKELIEKGKKS